MMSRMYDVLNRLGIRDRWDVSRASLTRFYDNDVYIVSMPRSGSNWTRFLLASLIHPELEVTFSNIDELIPGLTPWKEVDVDVLPRPRLIKSHFAAYERYPRFVYLVRDPRDVMVSWYHYLISIRQIETTHPFSKFIRSSRARWPLDWRRHVTRALDIAERDPKRALVVRYEGLKADPVATLSAMADFCRLDHSHSAVAEAVSRCEFDKLREMERTHKRRPDFRGRFFRSGQSVQWKSWFDDADMRWFLRRNALTMRRLGYLSSSQP